MTTEDKKYKLICIIKQKRNKRTGKRTIYYIVKQSKRGLTLKEILKEKYTIKEIMKMRPFEE